MSMPQAEPQARRDIALDWLLRLQQAPADAALEAACRAWRQAEPENDAAFRKAERLWHLTGQLPATTRPDWPALPPAAEAGAGARVIALPARPAQRRRWLAGAIAACLLLGLGAGLRTPLEADYRTARGELKTVELADGSRVQLDGDSAIAVAFSSGRREVRLLRGQAFFDVARDRERPFHVRAAALDVQVTGTAFNVDLGAARPAVAVAHGSVRVVDQEAGRELAAGLGAGQTLVLDADHHAQQGSQPVGQIAAWRDRRLIADNARLADMVERLEPYLPGVVLLRDAELAERRITGVYDLRNPEAALRAMAQPHGGRVASWSPFLLVISRGE